MPRVRKYHNGRKGPGHPYYTINNKAERQAANAADLNELYNTILKKGSYKQGRALKNLIKKYGAGGSVSDFGAQGNFTTKYTSNQPDVEELEDPNLILADVEELEDPNLILEENIIDAEAETEGQVPIAPMAEAENKVERAFSGAAKGVTVGSLLGPLGSLVGGAIGGIGGFLKGKKRKKRKERWKEIKASFNEGGALKGLIKKYKAGGYISNSKHRDKILKTLNKTQ